MNDADRAYTNELLAAILRLRYLFQVVIANTDVLTQSQWTACDHALDELATAILSNE